jgi:hypothetical protein
VNFSFPFDEHSPQKTKATGAETKKTQARLSLPVNTDNIFIVLSDGSWKKYEAFRLTEQLLNEKIVPDPDLVCTESDGESWFA